MKKLLGIFILSAIFSCGICLADTEEALARMHVILVTDLFADDLEEGVARDLKRMESVLTDIGKYTHLNICKKLFLGHKSDPEKLLLHIRELEAGHDDVIWFYFSGHGFRTNASNTDWPYLAFEKADKGIEYGELGDELIKKGARLTVLVADCCNNVMKISHAPKIKGFKSKRKTANAHSEEGYCRLFRKAHGVLMVAGAHPKEYSYADDDEGSSFTLAFIDSIRKYTSSPSNDLCWTLILNKTTRLLHKLTKDEKISQNPIILNKT
jgi:hypothetical protein